MRNPVNDVRAMAGTLRELGFTVLAHENTTKRAMETAILDFGRRLADGGVGFFYYAGHGLQVRGRNYLVPVDADIESEAATRIAAVDVDLLLLRALRVPGLKVEEVFKQVRVGVTSRSKGAQTPWESSSLTGDLVVNVSVNVATAAVPAPPTASDREALFWLSVKDSTDPAALEAYLKQYPEGTFAALARQRLASKAEPPRALAPGRFDGAWNVTVECPAHRGASGYTIRLLAHVKDGTLAAQQGGVGQPGSLTLRGQIQPDGKASIAARGMVGDPRTTGNRLSQGAPYAYRVDALFDGARGVGHRTDIRPCSLTFVK